MKQYGANFATEFNKKDLAPLYKAAKNGELNIEKWLMSRLYDLAEYYGYDDNRSIAHEESFILGIIREEDMAKKQERIDFYTESTFNSFTEKYQKKFDRNFVK